MKKILAAVLITLFVATTAFAGPHGYHRHRPGPGRHGHHIARPHHPGHGPARPHHPGHRPGHRY